MITWQALKSSSSVENSFDEWKKSFTQNMEYQLKKWFSTFPSGIGKATLISCFKIKFGKHYPNSGYYSAGNGPLMRAPLLGLYFHNNEIKRRESVKISTLLTHTHPFAILTAQSISEISALLKNKPEIKDDKNVLLNTILDILYNEKSQIVLNDKDNNTWKDCIDKITSLKTYQKEDFIKKTFPKGATGFCIHTLIMCISQLYYNNSITEVLKDTIYTGGDTDISSGISAAVFSLCIVEDTPYDISNLEKRITNPYCIKLFFSMIGFLKSLFTLYRYFYFFKK